MFTIKKNKKKAIYSQIGLELVAPLGRGPKLIERFIEKRGEGVFAVVFKYTVCNRWTRRNVNIRLAINTAAKLLINFYCVIAAYRVR